MHTEPISRPLIAELIGSLPLAATVVGSGIMAERLAGGSGCDVWATAGRIGAPTLGGRTVDGGRLDWRGLLVHGLDIIRQPCHYDRALAL
jgi:hypothetical protein